MKRTDSDLVELVRRLRRVGVLYLTGDTDEGYAELTLIWKPDQSFWIELETFRRGRTYPATLYEPAETIWHITGHIKDDVTGSINRVDKLLKSHGVNLAGMTDR